MINNKKLLIASDGYADIPLIKAAKKLGYYVYTSGNRPEEMKHKYSDEYRPADFSDPEAMLALAKDIGINAICPCCNDFSAISSAYVAEQMGLPGHDSYQTSLLIHHKDRYREFALENDIPTPKALGFTDVDTALEALQEFRFPLIVKPVDLTGGKGIARADNMIEAKQALDNAFAISKSRRVVVEEFIEGSRHGFSAIIRDGKVVFHFADNEHYYLNQYLVSAASAPSTISQDAVTELVSQSEKISKLLNLKTGIFHIQFIMHEGHPVIIEICRRPPGDLYIKLVEHATGIDYPSWIVRAFCGLDCSDMMQQDVNGFFLRHCIMGDRAGHLEKVTIDPQVEDNIIDSMMWWEAGEEIENYLTAKFGIVFLKFDSMDELLARSDEMQNLIHANIQ